MTKVSIYRSCFPSIFKSWTPENLIRLILELNKVLDDTLGFAFEHKQSLTGEQLNEFRDGYNLFVYLRDKNYGFGNETLFFHQFYQLAQIHIYMSPIHRKIYHDFLGRLSM